MIVLYTIAAILGLLWLVGLTMAWTLGGLIHLLPAIAIGVVLLQLIGVHRASY